MDEDTMPITTAITSPREVILAMAQEVIRAHRAQGSDNESRAVTHVAFEELLAALMTFNGPIDKASVRSTLLDPKDLLTSSSDLAAIPDGHRPVVVVRQVLSGNRVIMNSGLVFGWSQFVARYRQYIV